MPICVISTVGQSVFTQAEQSIKDAAREFSQKTDVDLKAIVNRSLAFPGHELYELTLASLNAQRSRPEYLKKASAEINSLMSILKGQKSNPNDILHFIASDTPDGVLAARVIADFCKEHFDRETKEHWVEGLQVKDSKRLRREGLRNLIATVYKSLESAPSGTYQRVINPTGGFKGIVPYLTIIGMLEAKVEVSYIYEYSPELITLGGLPIRLDFESTQEVYDVLESCDEDPANEKVIQDALKLNDRPVSDHPFWSLFEYTEIDGQGYYVVSALGKIILEHWRHHRERSMVYLSKQANDAFESFAPDKKRTYSRILSQMGDSKWRKLQEHATLEEDLKIGKPTGNERIYYFEEEKTVLIVAFAAHNDDSYERMGRLKRKDHEKFRIWEGKA